MNRYVVATTLYEPMAVAQVVEAPSRDAAIKLARRRSKRWELPRMTNLRVSPDELRDTTWVCAEVDGDGEWWSHDGGLTWEEKVPAQQPLEPCDLLE